MIHASVDCAEMKAIGRFQLSLECCGCYLLFVQDSSYAGHVLIESYVSLNINSPAVTILLSTGYQGGYVHAPRILCQVSILVTALEFCSTL